LLEEAASTTDTAAVRKEALQVSAMFQAVGDLVTLKWVREHPLVVGSIAAANVAIRYASQGQQDTDSGKEEAEGAAARVKSKQSTRRISWGDERGGKLEEMLEDCPQNRPLADDHEVEPESDAGEALIRHAEDVEQQHKGDTVGDPNSSFKLRQPQPKTKESEISADALTQSEAGHDPDKRESEADAETELETETEPGPTPETETTAERSSELAQQAIRTKQGMKKTTSFSSQTNLQLAPSSGAVLSELEGTQPPAQGAFRPNDTSSESSPSPNSSNSPSSPQWGWFVTMTPPQSNMYPRSSTAGRGQGQIDSQCPSDSAARHNINLVDTTTSHNTSSGRELKDD